MTIRGDTAATSLDCTEEKNKDLKQCVQNKSKCIKDLKQSFDYMEAQLNIASKNLEGAGVWSSMIVVHLQQAKDIDEDDKNVLIDAAKSTDKSLHGYIYDDQGINWARNEVWSIIGDGDLPKMPFYVEELTADAQHLLKSSDEL